MLTTCFFRKTYTTENAYRSHLNSKKHRESELKAASKPSPPPKEEIKEDEVVLPTLDESEAQPSITEQQQKAVSLTVDADATEDDVNRTIDEKIAAARTKLSPSTCLFCSESSGSHEDNLTHMSIFHSFFIPDAEYLVDITGLVTYLGEKIAVGNVCIHCAKEFSTLDAVRKHMVDKSHCKIAYDTDGERLEVSDYYDFSASYPDATERKRRSKSKKSKTAEGVIQEDGEEEWEDVDGEDGDGEVDEVVDEEDGDGPGDSDSDGLDETLQVAYGDTPYELILPTGIKVGHRSLYRRAHPPSSSALSIRRRNNPLAPSDGESGAALVRKLLADKNSALVPRKGGFGAFGGGFDVVKARNPGEAREAGRHVKKFRDQQRREQFKTKVGFRNNNQKHFRDPLLQVSIFGFVRI